MQIVDLVDKVSLLLWYDFTFWIFWFSNSQLEHFQWDNLLALLWIYQVYVALV